MKQDTTLVCQIVAPGGRAVAQMVPELGGMVSSLVFPSPNGPRECLYRHEWFWDPETDKTRGGIPLLFPVCGRHPDLPIHGFAMRMPWRILEQKVSFIRLGLEDTSRTRKVFPYSFNLQLEYRIAENELFCGFAVRNTGPVSMPFYAGFHPCFLAPGDKTKIILEASPGKRHLYSDDFTGIIGTARPPEFPVSIADPSLNQMLLEFKGKSETTLMFPDGFELKMDASDHFRYRQIYAIPGESFFCVEPWMAPPGAILRGEHLSLNPGETISASMVISARSMI